MFIVTDEKGFEDAILMLTNNILHLKSGSEYIRRVLDTLKDEKDACTYSTVIECIQEFEQDINKLNEVKHLEEITKHYKKRFTDDVDEYKRTALLLAYGAKIVDLKS